MMTKIAVGNTAEIFDYENGKVLKLFKSGYPVENIRREFDNSRLINKLGISSPKVYEILDEVSEGRTGIVYEKIFGHDLLQEVMTNIQNMEYVEKRIESLAFLHKDFINHTSKECISYKDYLNYFGYPKTEDLPDGEYLCHGDFHFGNLLRTSEDSERILVIDFMNLCHGPKEYDIARAYVLLTEDNLGSGIDPEIRKLLLQAKMAAGQLYLLKMGYKLEEIEKFIPAIKFCREKEML
ncbi:MAG: phosphotransferase [Treponema sp.]|nr:phosphotransferase [Treponema sp.]